MRAQFTFAPGQEVNFLCECGGIKGTPELCAWGIRVFFECRDCDTSFCMEVKG